jgi:hypothetical protein
MKTPAEIADLIDALRRSADYAYHHGAPLTGLVVGAQAAAFAWLIGQPDLAPGSDDFATVVTKAIEFRETQRARLAQAERRSPN